MVKTTQMVLISITLIIYPIVSIAIDYYMVNENTIQEILPVMAGTWIYDLDYFIEYLKETSELQKTWCGYGWTESDIKKREKYMRDSYPKSGSILTYYISYLGNDSLEVQVVNDENEKKQKIYSDFKLLESNIIICQQSPDSDQPFVFRFDGKYIYLLIKLSPEMMQCKLKTREPSEFWLTAMRLKRSAMN